jgi:crotonobetainyl-CoA:carnitine CoA-transferase CaiB-like acyl-CoA transferase
MAITGEPGGVPMKHGVALADVIAGKDAAIAITAAVAAVARAALRGQRVPPEARRVVVSLATSAAAALVNVAQNVLVGGREAARWGNAHANLVPYQLFDASDRPFVLAVGTDAQWPAAARTLGLPALAAEPALATNAGRLAARDRLVAAIAAVAATRTAAEWCAALEAAGVPCGVVRPVTDVLASLEADAKTGLPSPVGGHVHRPPPRLDEHGPAIRAAGGWSQS